MSINKKVAVAFDLLAKLMELHNENPFKIRSYANAHLTLRKLEKNLSEMSMDELAEIKGIGDAIASKIEEFLQNGSMKILEKYKSITPVGIQELLSIKGLGPKKVRQIWHELEITSAGELLYACNENRIAQLRGFGVKVQEDLILKLEYFLESRGKMLYAHVIKNAEICLSNLMHAYPNACFSLTGALRRKMPEVRGIDILTDLPTESDFSGISGIEDHDSNYLYEGIPLYFTHTSNESFQQTLFEQSCSEDFLKLFSDSELYQHTEEEIFKSKGVHFIPAECREEARALDVFAQPSPSLISASDIKGIVHAHSTYSDGLHTLREMAAYTRASGYQYLVITDHSKSAGYAGGLSEERVMEQWQEIDALNLEMGPAFRIFKGIESDILSEGALDYKDTILQGFDVVIASIHSGMQMTEEKATSRIIRAIENPYTKILGHPTGRLLLARPGYPINHRKIIDACALNGVAIELNANPQRLDIDWTWVPYAMEKGVYIAINPDAHSRESIHFVSHGIDVARKGLLTSEKCLNSLSLVDFEVWLNRKSHK